MASFRFLVDLEMAALFEGVFEMSYSVAQARKIMAETDRHLANDPRLAGVTAARASATTPPPQLGFADIILQKQEEDPDLRLPEAVRLAAIEKPELHAAWVEKENTKMQNAEQEKQESAARVRNRNRR